MDTHKYMKVIHKTHSSVSMARDVSCRLCFRSTSNTCGGRTKECLFLESALYSLGYLCLRPRELAVHLDVGARPPVLRRLERRKLDGSRVRRLSLLQGRVSLEHAENVVENARRGWLQRGTAASACGSTGRPARNTAAAARCLPLWGFSHLPPRSVRTRKQRWPF